MKKNLFLFLLVCLLLISVSCSQSNNPVLTIEGGKIVGVETPTKGVIAYKGIPFAAPPLGDLRWKEPQPVIPWEGVKVADTYGDAACQVTWDPESFYGKEWRASGSVPFTEDCLYLNLWTPAAGQTNKKLPVAMWIHGGGYREGFSYEPEMDGGEDWASRGVILVQVTYRLGVIGFFSHPLLSAESPHSVSGNYGVMDQAAALKWIHDNIEQFGGDPENITIFGQSAGAGSVQTLCASPISRDMISKAISMSGGGLGNSRMPRMSFDEVQKANKEMMDHFGKTTLEEMRALSFEELTKMASEYGTVSKKRMFYSPVVENYFLTSSFSDAALANEIPDIPYMFGYTANDLGDMTKPIQDFCALRAEKSKKPAYAYLFARQLPGDSSGAFHSSDLWYVFHSFRHSWRPFTKGDDALSLKIVDYWTNFATYGEPNGKDGGIWTPYTVESPKFMILDANENEALCSMTETPEYKGSTFKWFTLPAATKNK
ncbi:carboxylesterase family protein [candidate division KSB1 bacterium]|nr:carboxylesterase family protein [candidate division KSB1 bacterium]